MIKNEFDDSLMSFKAFIYPVTGNSPTLSLVEVTPKSILIKDVGNESTLLESSFDNLQLQVHPISAVSLFSFSIFVYLDSSKIEVFLDFSTEEERKSAINELITSNESITLFPNSALIIPELAEFPTLLDVHRRFGVCFYQSIDNVWIKCHANLSRKHLTITSNSDPNSIIFRSKLNKIQCFTEGPSQLQDIERTIEQAAQTLMISDVVVLNTNFSESYNIKPGAFYLGFCSFPLSMSWVRDINRNKLIYFEQECVNPYWMVSKSGFLLKRGEGMTGFQFKKRWFVLSKANLLYFLNPHDLRPLGRIPLEQTAILPVVEGDDVLKIITAGQKTRTWVLRFASADERLQWNDAFKRVIQGLRKEKEEVNRQSVESQRRQSQQSATDDEQTSVSSVTLVKFCPMSGWLEKLGYFNRQFKSRYFKLFPGELHYFESDVFNSAPKGIIDLKGCYVNFLSHFLESQDPSAFAIQTDKRLWILRHENIMVSKEWIRCIRIASKSEVEGGGRKGSVKRGSISRKLSLSGRNKSKIKNFEISDSPLGSL
ncbi:hypothetical protein GEMRC1_006882 [Eukaryota sp. GEM-RC1]